MKIVTTVLALLLSYNLSALACGGKTSSQYSIATKAKEISIPLGQKEVLILNSHERKVTIPDQYSPTNLVPVRIEMASDSKVEIVAIRSWGSTTYLTQFAVYKCPGSPTRTSDLYLDINKYSSVEIFLLKGEQTTIAQNQKADFVLEGEKLEKLLK